MDAPGIKDAYTGPVDLSFGERLIRSLVISGTFWPELANVNAFDPSDTPGAASDETRSPAKHPPQGSAYLFYR